ncbi:MAG: N-6 DNA methylase, partial [Streptosporangiaceae bacterium]
MPDPTDVRVTLAEIARIAGVGRAAVSNWRRRHDTFPAPVGGSDASPQFSLADVEQWLRQQGKVEGVDAEERLWPQFEALGDRTLAGLAIAELGRDVLTDEVTMLRPAGVRVPEAASAAVRSSGQERGRELFDFLVNRWLDAYVRQVIVTPASLARLMIDVADVFSASSGKPTSVLDPACGSGGLLLAAACRWGEGERRSEDLILAGTDRDPALASLAAVRLGFAYAAHRGFGASEAREAGRAEAPVGADVRVGDSLRNDPHSGFRADVVVSNPPFNERDWGHEELATDPRWTYGLPPRTEPELAWVEHALARLKPGGIAVLLMPPAVASRRAGRRIRGALLRAGVVRGVIALPAGSAVPYGVSLYLWVLQSPVPGSAGGRQVLLLDAGASGRGAGATGHSIDWPRLHEQVMAAVRWHVKYGRGGAGRDGPVPGAGGVVVPAMSLLDERVDLTPARYVPTAGSLNRSQLHDLQQRFGRLLDDLSELAEPLSLIDLADEDGAAAATTVGDLDRAQALAVHAGREVAAELTRIDSPSEQAVPVLTVADLLRDGKPSSWLPADQVSRAGSLLTIAEPGDVVVVGVERAYRAWVQVDGPVVLGAQLYSLHLDQSLLDPWFMAGCLRAPANA